MSRKTKLDPFAGLAPETPLEPVDAVPEVLTRKPSQARRDREWEYQERRDGDVATYRGVPKHLQQELKRIAAKHHVPVGEIVRYFLEYALVAYERGDLLLQAEFGPGKLTLYPTRSE